MTSQLHKAFEKAANLPESDQKLLASQILDDIKNELNWKTALENTSDKVADLARKAIKMHKAGKTKKLGFDEL